MKTINNKPSILNFLFKPLGLPKNSNQRTIALVTSIVFGILTLGIAPVSYYLIKSCFYKKIRI